LNIKCITKDATLDVAFNSKTILESLENIGVEVQFHCREGFCGACRCKIISGEVNYTTDPLAFIDDDEILLCCSVPLTDIEIIVE